MLAIDLKGKRALVAGVADDAGFGFAIAKALAEAGATVVLGTWPPALNIFETLLRRVWQTGQGDEDTWHEFAGTEGGAIGDHDRDAQRDAVTSRLVACVRVAVGGRAGGG